jgi:hypothetical protein
LKLLTVGYLSGHEAKRSPSPDINVMAGLKGNRSMTTIPPLNLSALTILRDSRQPGYEDAAQDTARRILASYTVNDEALANALKTISETLFGSGNTSAGEDGSTINGSNNSDKIRSGSRSTVNGGAGDDSIHAGHNSVVKGGAGRDIILGDTETTIVAATVTISSLVAPTTAWPTALCAEGKATTC